MTPCVRQRGAYIDVWADRAVLSLVASAARVELRDDALFLSIVVPRDESDTHASPESAEGSTTGRVVWSRTRERLTDVRRRAAGGTR